MNIYQLLHALSAYKHYRYKCIHFYLFSTLVWITAVEALPGITVTFLCCLAFSLRSLSVAMFYRNDSSVADPYYLTLPGCAQMCPLKDFIRLTQSVIPTDWHKECQISSSANDKGIDKSKFHTPFHTIFCLSLNEINNISCFSLLYVGTDVVVGLIACGFILLLLVVALFVVLCRQSEPVIGYTHIINQSDDHSWQSYQFLCNPELLDSGDLQKPSQTHQKVSSIIQPTGLLWIIFRPF